MLKKIVVSGVGCSLADFLYMGISFESDNFRKYLSKINGDGGLSPGKLVFTEELEKFAGQPYSEILKEITQNHSSNTFNVGGPCLVSLIHASQLLDNQHFSVKLYGGVSNDPTAERILKTIIKTPLDIANFKVISDKPSPFTDVLSDPDFDNGHGERTFINNIGAAWDYKPDYLDEAFFSSDVVCFGGTALVPQIHDNLLPLLIRAKQNRAITVVNTVFDFRNEKRNPGRPWLLGDNEETYKWIDVLVLDYEEAIKITGKGTINEVISHLIGKQASSFIITNGANDITVFSDGKLFRKTEVLKLPVSEKVKNELKSSPELKGDTTGCGDNFAGGIIASLAWQLKAREKGQFDLTEAVSWAVASGGFACYYVGGAYIENLPGEKLFKVQEIQNAYLRQIGVSG